MSDSEYRRLVELILTYKVSEVLRTTVELGLAEQLAEGRLTLHELASRCGADPATLRSLLRVLLAIDVFDEHEASGDGSDSSYGLTQMGSLLVSNPFVGTPPAQLAASAVADRNRLAWSRLTETVRTGQPVFTDLFAEPFYDFLDANEPDSERFYERTSPGQHSYYLAVAWAYDFGSSTIVDVGGGYGGLLTAILDFHRDARGILFDRPAVIDALEHRCLPDTLAARAELVPGDCTSWVPPGGDIYLVSSLIEDLGDADAVCLLGACRSAMPEHARLVVVEELLDATTPVVFLLEDLQRQLVFGGQRRSIADFEELLRRSGFALQAVHPTWTGVSILEAVPA